MVTEQELKVVMREHRWSYLPRVRGGRSYIYAQRKMGGKKMERYVCAYTALSQLSLSQLLAKLDRQRNQGTQQL
jgi:hypothetical protein